MKYCKVLSDELYFAMNWEVSTSGFVVQYASVVDYVSLTFVFDGISLSQDEIAGALRRYKSETNLTAGVL